MISHYEIRENSLTQNSTFLLLIKGDEQGCSDIKRELSAFCNLISNKVKGFDYVFELSGITDDSMLEKLRSRLDFISSSSLGVTQTFDNMNKTAIINIESATVDKEMLESNNISMTLSDTSTNGIKDFAKTDKTSRIFLSNTNCSISREGDGESISFTEVSEKSPLVSSDDKEIEIETGMPSLQLAKTIPSIRQTMPTLEKQTSNVNQETSIGQGNISKLDDMLSNNTTNNDISKQQEMKKGSSVEEENKTIISYNNDELKGISISLEKQKNSIFGGFWGKIKSAIHSKHDQQTKVSNIQPKEQPPLDKLIKRDIKQEKKDSSIGNSQNTTKEEYNPFQDLGEGIIVKKGLLLEENINSVKQELSANSVTAKLQVDDIFAAETICDFYANQPSTQEQENKSVHKKEQTPLDNLKRSKEQKIDTKPNITVEETIPTQTKHIESVTTQTKNEHIEPNNQEKITVQSKIIVKKDLNKLEEKPTISDKLPPSNNKQKEGKIIPQNINLAMNKERHSEQVEVQKEEPIFRPLLKEETKMNKENKEQVVPTKQAPKTNLNSNMMAQNTKLKNNAKIDHTLHVATPSNNVKYRNYPIEMPLIPTYTFANMDISSIRFAHAMAMATLDDLGKSNNPFLLQGTGGTGKTHFLHAMGYEISKKIPQSKILFTNGVRLSRGVQYLLEQGQQDKLDSFFSNAEVLIVDDIHLTAINEHNREFISKILNDFLRNKKQIIISSKYPPESLKRFEELVNFKFSLGTMAELKVPNKDHCSHLTKKMVFESFLDLTDQQIQNFFLNQNDSLGNVARDIKRVKVLFRRIESSGIKKLSYEEILKKMTAFNGEDGSSEIIKKDFSEITALDRSKEGSWGNFGFFFPSSQIDKFRWVAFASQEAAKNLGIKGGFNYALKSAYSTEHIISAAFKIANICDLKGLKGAVILGPSFIECSEPIRDNFYDILTHLLEIMMIRCGTINFEDIKKPSAYVKMLGDILK